MKTPCRKSYQRYQEHLKEEKKKAAGKDKDKAKQILDAEIKEIEEKIENLTEISSSLDMKFVDLVKNAENNKNASLIISEANGLKRKSEEQVKECQKLGEALKLLKTKRSKLH